MGISVRPEIRIGEACRRSGPLLIYVKNTIVSALLLFVLFQGSQVQAQNPIVTENALPGNPPSEWDVINAGDPSIQGFATEFSVSKGSTVRFKINVTSANKNFSIRIYRLGYYQGNGARLVADLGSFTGVTQPAGIADATGLLDCGNWTETASWNIPSTAVSGIYIAKLIRSDNPTLGTSHITFVVRDDARNAHILFKTSDATWQAYNNYGGNSLYVGSIIQYSLIGRAAKVSYNRPFKTRDLKPESFLFNADYPLLRWLERNGYDVNYSTDLDFERDATPITPAKNRVIVSPAHDEYWSLAERNRVEAARDAGVHLAFFSGNEVYWKTRWENSIDGNNTPHRTLVCFKEGTFGQGEYPCGQDYPGNANCDPLAGMWTGLWRFGAAEDGGRPENALTGQISWIEKSSPLKVPAEFKDLRFWRNTSVASLGAGQEAVLGQDVLGYEFNYELDAFKSTYPSGRILMSSTTVTGDGLGNTVVGRSYTHKLSLYRHSSGALVFGAGTCQWAWGLDDNHDRERRAPSVDIQQATVNLLADMNVQPATLQPGLVPATMSTDFTAPTAVITFPANNANFGQDGPITIRGTASDAGGGVVAGVEISVDGGVTWQVANGRTNWTYTFTPGKTGPVNIRVRGFDDSGNMQAVGASPSGNNITINGICPCNIFPEKTYTNLEPLQNAANLPINLGVRFRSSQNGYITGVRFYKQAGNAGTHVGQLYSASGTLLASATFTNETTSGWQQVTFNPAVPITAGTTYVASYFSPLGFFTKSLENFSNPVTNGPLTALSVPGMTTGNGMYRIFPTPAYPQDESGEQTNYMVDVIFNTSSSCSITGTLATSGPVCAGQEINLQLTAASGTAPFTLTLNNDTVQNITSNLIFPSGVVATDADFVNATIFSSGDSWMLPFIPETNSVEVGLKFRVTTPGVITHIRFFKDPLNTGIHSGRIWTLNGTIPLGVATFTSETASGWQTAKLSSPVPVQPGVTYVVSYHSQNGHYTEMLGFGSMGVNNPPLIALDNSVDGPNGVRKLGGPGINPAIGPDGSGANYGVDVVFTATTTIRYTQITDALANVCFQNNPELQTFVLQPVNCAFLPVALADFRLTVNKNDVLLQWVTSSENNNKGFDVERSTDGQDWHAIGFVPGAVDSQTPKRYQFTDRGLPEGKYFYRLKQVDLNGVYKYSKILNAVIAGQLRYALLQNYPNPANGLTTIGYSLPVRGHMSLALYDMQGRLVKQLVDKVVDAGTHTVDLDARGLSPGVYQYKMTSGDFQTVRRLLVN